jgi:hypothetical protein
MPQMTYGVSNVGISLPAGRYVARFVGTEERDPIQDSKYGNDNAPRMAWVFEVVEGPKAGERFAQETGVKATPKSGCARVILGLAGGTVNVGQRVDTDQFVGRTYAVKIGPNPNSDKGNLYVADIEPHAGAAQGGAPAPAARAGGPPPRKPPAAAPAAAAPRYYIDYPDHPHDKLYSAEDVRSLVFAKGLKAKELMLCKDGDPDWQPAETYGFEDAKF